MNYLFLALGFLFLGVGTVEYSSHSAHCSLPASGIVLLLRGLPRSNDWFQGTRLYQNHLADFKKDRR